jgi:2'-5' RNA ligase superfamily
MNRPNPKTSIDPAYDNPYRYARSLIESSGVARAGDGFTRTIKYSTEERAYRTPHITLIDFDIPIYDDFNVKSNQVKKVLTSYAQSIKAQVAGKVFTFNQLDFSHDNAWLRARFNVPDGVKVLRGQIEKYIKEKYPTAKFSFPNWEPHMTLGKYDPAASQSLKEKFKQPEAPKPYRFFVQRDPFWVSATKITDPKTFDEAKQKFMQ